MDETGTWIPNYKGRQSFGYHEQLYWPPPFAVRPPFTVGQSATLPRLPCAPTGRLQSWADPCSGDSNPRPRRPSLGSPPPWCFRGAAESSRDCHHHLVCVRVPGGVRRGGAGVQGRGLVFVSVSVYTRTRLCPRTPVSVHMYVFVRVSVRPHRGPVSGTSAHTCVDVKECGHVCDTDRVDPHGKRSILGPTAGNS